MKRTLFLAGGFWGFFRREYGRTLESHDDGEKSADWIISITGLPDEYFKPAQIKSIKKYFCKQCQRDVSEWEMERKEGCFFHDLKMEESKKEVWESDIFERYTIEKKKFITNGFRIWVNNENGMEKFRIIWRYVDKNFPATISVPLPVPVGAKNVVYIENETDIPIIDLEKYQTIVAEAQPEMLTNINNTPEINEAISALAPTERPFTDDFKCKLCGKQYDDIKKVRMHCFAAHGRDVKATA